MKNRETLIKISENNGRWFYHISLDNWQASGYENSLEKAESKAFDIVNTIPNSGIVHIKYEGGKKVVHSDEISFKEALLEAGFIKAAQ